MNPTVILALISDLYNQIAMLTAENSQLQAALSEQTENAKPKSDLEV
jgi:hypothetical protein